MKRDIANSQTLILSTLPGYEHEELDRPRIEEEWERKFCREDRPPLDTSGIDRTIEELRKRELRPPRTSYQADEERLSAGRSALIITTSPSSGVKT